MLATCSAWNELALIVEGVWRHKSLRGSYCENNALLLPPSIPSLLLCLFLVQVPLGVGVLMTTLGGCPLSTWFFRPTMIRRWEHSDLERKQPLAGIAFSCLESGSTYILTSKRFCYYFLAM